MLLRDRSLLLLLLLRLVLLILRMALLPPCKAKHVHDSLQRIRMMMIDFAIRVIVFVVAAAAAAAAAAVGRRCCFFSVNGDFGILSLDLCCLHWSA